MLIPGILHDGGPVSGATGNRAVPASLFNGADYYHSGGPVLKPGEQPAILQTGEHVLSRAQVRKLNEDGGIGGTSGGVGGGEGYRPAQQIQVVQNIQTPDANSFRKSQKQIAADMGRATQRAIRSND